MPIITPPTVTLLPPAPSSANPSSFDLLADNYTGALPTHREELVALAQNIYNNAVAIATEIGASSVWISGSTYTVNTVRFSPLDGRNYKCVVATNGSDVTDPSLHYAKWRLVVPNVPGNLIYTAQIYGVF